jgi:hypothetical protein
VKVYITHETAKDPEAWVAQANAAAAKHGEARSFTLVSVEGSTPSGRKQFTVEIAKAELAVYSVTAEWEDENEGENVSTFAVLAASPQQAEDFGRAFITDARVIWDRDSVSIEVRPFRGVLQPRVVAELVVKNDRPVWRDATVAK